MSTTYDTSASRQAERAGLRIFCKNLFRNANPYQSYGKSDNPGGRAKTGFIGKANRPKSEKPVKPHRKNRNAPLGRSSWFRRMNGLRRFGRWRRFSRGSGRFRRMRRGLGLRSLRICHCGSLSFARACQGNSRFRQD